MYMLKPREYSLETTSKQFGFHQVIMFSSVAHVVDEGLNKAYEI
jgi:hypothetical protein